MKGNPEIRERARQGGVMLWQLACEIGVSEPTLIRWLRVPLSEAKRTIVENALDTLIAAREREVKDAKTAHTE